MGGTINVLVIAKSLKSSSAFGARSHSFKLALVNSLPMIGVTSKESNSSRTPDSFNGSRRSLFDEALEESTPLTTIVSVAAGVISATEGAILDTVPLIANVFLELNGRRALKV